MLGLSSMITSMLILFHGAASVPLLSRILPSFSGCEMPSTAAGFRFPKRENDDNSMIELQCNPKSATCSYDFEDAEPLKSKSCLCRPNTTDMSTQGHLKCDCSVAKAAKKSCSCSPSDQLYYNKRIKEEISDWLKDVPVYNNESPKRKIQRENMVKELGNKLNQLPDDENFDENVTKEINSFMDDFPMWYPDKNKKDQFKQQLADKLKEKIIDIPRKPDKFRDIVKKWIREIHFRTDDKDVNIEIITDNFVNHLKALAANRQESDSYYKNKLRQEIIKMLQKLPLSIEDDEEAILKKMANKLATEIVMIPKNFDVTEDRSDLKDLFIENIVRWLKEIGMCRQSIHNLQRDPTLIEGLAKKLNTLKGQDSDTLAKISKIKERIMQSLLGGFERSITESSISEDKKMDTINKLKKMVAKNLNKPLSDDLQDKIENEISNILAELPLTREEKKKLQNELTDMVDKAIESLRNVEKEVDESKTIERILQGIEKTVEESSLPEEKKEELKKKLTKMAMKNLQNLQSADVQDILNSGIINILNGLNLPTDEKNKLINELIEMIDEHVKIIDTDTQDRIMQDIEKAIEEETIPREIKMKLKKNLKDLEADFFNKPLSDDVIDIFKEGINNTIDEQPLSKEKKNQLKQKLTDIVDENILKLRERPSPQKDVDGSKMTESILQGIEKIVDKSSLPEEKKKELKKRLKIMAAESLQNPQSPELRDVLNEGIINILNELNLPKDEKNRLNKELVDLIDENIESWKNEMNQEDNADLKIIETSTKDRILQDIEKAIGEENIPKEKKMEFMKNVNDLAADNFDKPLSDEVLEIFKGGINNIIEDQPISKENKNKLKQKLTDIIDENMSIFHDYIKELDKTQSKKARSGQSSQKEIVGSKMTKSILQGIEKTIDESSLSEDKKKEVKRKLKRMAVKILRNPQSADVQDALKDGIRNIVNRLNLPKDETNKLINQLFDMIDKNVVSSKDEMNQADNKVLKMIETLTQDRILLDIEKTIEEEAIPKENKMEFKKNVKDLAASNFNKTLSDDVLDIFKDGISNITDKQPLSKEKKNKLKQKLTDIIDENMSNFHDYIKELDRTQPKKERKSPAPKEDDLEITESILHGIEKTIDESSIPEEKKRELKRRLKRMAAKSLQNPQSADAQDALKFGIKSLLDELKNEQNKLKNHQNDDDDDIARTKRRRRNSNFMQEMENLVSNTSISEEKKYQVKKELERVASEDLQDPLGNVNTHIKHGINVLLNEMPFSKEKKKNLKKVLTNMIEKNVRDDKKETKIIQVLAAIQALLDKNQDITDPDYREMIENIIHSEIENLMAGTTDVATAKKKVRLAMWVDTNLSSDQACDLSNKLVDKAVEMLASTKLIKPQAQLKRRDTNILYTVSYGSPYDIDNEDALVEVLLNNIDSNVMNSKPATILQRRIKQSISKAISDVIEQSTIPQTIKNNLKIKLTNKLEQNVDKSLLSQKKYIDDITAEVINDTINIVDESSVPTNKKTKLVFQLVQALTKDIKGIHELNMNTRIFLDRDQASSSMKPRKTGSKPKLGSKGVTMARATTAKEYLDELTNAIETWLDNMSVDFEPELKTAKMNALASDIVDRQKHLQSHPEVESTYQGELKNLKYLVFRILRKMVDAEDMEYIMEGVEDLLEKINEIQAPLKSKSKRETQTG